MNNNQICAERMYLNSDKTKVVAHGHKDAAFLYASPGDEIPGTAAERFGIQEGAVPKEGRVPPNKEKAPGEDKGGSGGKSKGGKPKKPTKPEKPNAAGNASANASAKLDDIAGIGPATSGALVAAGIADVAALAAIDPASPPTVETLPPGFSWESVVADAKRLVPVEA